MRVIIALVIFVVLAALFYYFFLTPEERDTDSPAGTLITPGRSVDAAPLPENTRMREVEIRQRAAKAGAQMRVISVALGAYKVDNGAFPVSLDNLTTPVAYILMEMPTDPFTENLSFGYKLEENGDWLLWSVGPDAVDDGGRIEYDQEGGTGDILFRTSDAPSRFR